MPDTWIARFWRCRRGRLREQFPLDPHVPGAGSWLYARCEDGQVLGLGCKACHFADVDSNYGKANLSRPRQCKISRLRAHADCTVHRQAVIALTECKACQVVLTERKEAMQAPTANQFKLVWDARRKGGPAAPLANVGDRKKRQRMEFCLAEVCRIRNRVFVQDAQVLATHIDGKEDRLTMEFSCAQGRGIKRLMGCGWDDQARWYCDGQN